MSKAQFNKRSECSGSIYTYTGGIMTYNYVPGDVLDLSQFGQFPEGATVAELDRNGDGLVTVADTGGIAMIAYNAGRLVIRFSPSNIIYLNGTASIELACITGPSQSPIPTPEEPTPEPEIPPSSNETEPTPPPSPAPAYVPSPIEPPSNETSPMPPTGSPSGEPNEPPSSPPVEEPGAPESEPAPEPEVPPFGEPNEPPSTPTTPPPVEEPAMPPMEAPSNSTPSAEPPVPSPSEIPSSPPPVGEPQTPPMEPPSGGQTPTPSEEPPVSPPQSEPASPPAPVYVPSPAQPPSAGPEPVDSPEEPVPSPVPPYEPPFTPAPMEGPSNTTSPIDTPSPSTQKPEPELPQTSGSGHLEPDFLRFIPVMPLIKSVNWLRLAGQHFSRWMDTPATPAQSPVIVQEETLSSYESGQKYDRAMRALSEQHAISPASAHKIVNEHGFTETVVQEADGTTSVSITLPPEAQSTVKQAQRMESMTVEQVAQVNPGFSTASFASLVLFGVAAWRHYKTQAEAQRVLSPKEVQEALVTLKKELTINTKKLERLEQSTIVQTSDPQNYAVILDQQKGYLEDDKAAYRRIKKGTDVRQGEIYELQENIGEMRKFLAHYYTEQYETYAERLQAERSNAPSHSKRA